MAATLTWHRKLRWGYSIMPKRIAISVPVIGGTGGSERAVWSIAHALSDDKIDVFPRRDLGGKLADFPANTRVKGNLWTRRVGTRMPGYIWVNSFLRWVRKTLLPIYDVHLHFMHGWPDANRVIRARMRFVDPIGSRLDAPVFDSYDAALLEAPSNLAFIPAHMPSVVLPPPWYPLANRGGLPPGLPDRFFLTVMNPYGPVKGAELLRRVAPSAALPLVWCYSEQSIAAHELGALPQNVIPIVDATQEQILGLHHACEAYVSFSHSEGFGWSIADAMMAGSPVVSRRTGLLTLPGLDLRGVVFFDDAGQLGGILTGWDGAERVNRLLPELEPTRFASEFWKAVADLSATDRSADLGVAEPDDHDR